MWSVEKNLDPPLEIIPKTQSHNLFAKQKKIQTPSCLTYMFEIGAKQRESSLVIIPNHKPLKGSLLSWSHLTIKYEGTKAFIY